MPIAGTHELFFKCMYLLLVKSGREFSDVIDHFLCRLADRAGGHLFIRIVEASPVIVIIQVKSKSRISRDYSKRLCRDITVKTVYFIILQKFLETNKRIYVNADVYCGVLLFKALNQVGGSSKWVRGKCLKG